MANKQSSILSNRGSVTAAGTANSPANERGKLRTVNGSVALVAADLTNDDTLMLCALPKRAVVLQIWIANDDLEGATPAMTADIGLWADADGVTVKDADVYALDTTQFQAAAGFTDLAFATRGIELNGQKVWEDAGDASADATDDEEYFLGIQFKDVGANPQAGDLAFQVVYAVE